MRPQARSARSQAAGAGSASARAVSCQLRSGTSASASPAATIARMRASVSGAIVKPSGSKRARKRATRSIRTGSSLKASDTCLSLRDSRSTRPPCGSINVPSASRAIALMVRSRRYQVVLERDVGRKLQLEAAIARPGLALGAGERVLLAGLGVQEHREVPADLAVAEVQHLLRRCADHDPVALADRPAEQLVANRAADQIDFHRIMLRDSPWRPIRLLAAAAAAMVLGGCYYTHIAAGQLEMNSRREPIAEVIANPATEATLRRRLEFAVRARDFAMADLGLPDNGSYRTFADLGRRYATWNLFAAPELSIEPKRWCFPIAGCVSYRGYFDEAHAARAAAKLRKRGYDTWVGPSIAYSTLGHLRDPVLNTMLGYGDAELAAFIFHELAHQAAYAPGDSDFNEAFAMVVEAEGLRRWYAREGPPGAIEKFNAARKRQHDVAALMVDARNRLAGIYARTPDAAAARAQKSCGIRPPRRGAHRRRPAGAR